MVRRHPLLWRKVAPHPGLLAIVAPHARLLDVSYAHRSRTLNRLYSTRSERLLMEQLDDNLLFR